MNADVILKIERVVLSAILFTPDKYDEVADLINFRDFLDKRHGCMFQAIDTLRKKNEAVTPEMLYLEISKTMSIDMDYIVLVNSESPIANVDSFVNQIKNASINRALFDIAGFLRDSSQKDGADAKDTLNELEKKVYNLSLQDYKSDFKTGKEVLISTLELIRDNKANHEAGTIKGIDTGFEGLNEATTGFNGGELIVIGARPSMGKTALILSMTLKILASGKGVAIFSLEMPAEQLMLRMMSARGRIAFQDLRSGNLIEQDLEKLTLTTNELCDKANLYIDDGNDLSIASLRSKVRKLTLRDNSVKIIIIDYLQLMEGANTTNDSKRHEVVAEISRGLKKLAREINMPIIALSQLNRGLESRTDKRPILADMRESGAIEQDADIIIFLYRDEIYKERLSKEMAQEQIKKGKPKNQIEIYKAKPIEDVELILAKNRNGETKTVHIKFNKKYTLFEDVREQQEIELAEQISASIRIDNTPDIDSKSFPL